MIRGNRLADKIRNNNPHGKFWDYLPVENGDDGMLESDLLTINLKYNMLKTKHNIGVGGMPITITWEIGDIIDKHDSGSADVQLTGKGDDNYDYEANGVTQDGVLVDVIEDTVFIVE